jgi:hypothetical protein
VSQRTIDPRERCAWAGRDEDILVLTLFGVHIVLLGQRRGLGPLGSLSQVAIPTQPQPPRASEREV